MMLATVETPTVPCQWCQAPTRMLATKLCDFCYELDTRVRRNPDLARRILADIDAKAEAKRTAEVRLKMLDDAKTLERELSAPAGLNISALWVLWEDDTYQRVVYGFNPGNSQDVCDRADRGRHRGEELMRWARSRCSYHLSPTLPDRG